jgi:hypothetical protein
MAKWKNPIVLDAELDVIAMADEVVICSDQPSTWYEATNPPAWSNGVVKALGDAVRPTARNGYTYECTTAGTTGSTEPTWPTTVGATVTDGTVTWTCRQSYALANASLTASAFSKSNGGLPAYAVWAASQAKNIGDMVVPPVANGYCYECTVAGTTGSTAPTWPTTERATVTDGTVTWTCRSILGRQQTMAQQSNITIHAGGASSATATHIALLRSSDKKLLMVDQCTPQTLTAGNLATINSLTDVIDQPI